MSDPSQGTGWWQASDGKWYPPHLLPGGAGRVSPPEAAPAAQPGRGRSLLRLIAVVSSVLLVVTAGTAVGLYITSKASAIGLGSGTATITWKPAGAGSVNATSGAIDDPPQPFTGTIEGSRVSGSATLFVPPRSGLPPKGSFPLVRYTGSFAGKRFNLEVTVSLASFPVSVSSSTAPLSNAEFLVNGTWGTDDVHADVTPPSDPSSTSVRFHGNVGQWKVAGTIHQPTSGRSTSTVTASFTVRQ